MAKIPKAVKLDGWLWDKLEKIAWERRISRNQLVEMVLKSYVKRLDLASRSDLRDET